MKPLSSFRLVERKFIMKTGTNVLKHVLTIKINKLDHVFIIENCTNVFCKKLIFISLQK